MRRAYLGQVPSKNLVLRFSTLLLAGQFWSCFRVDVACLSLGLGRKSASPPSSLVPGAPPQQ